MDDPHEEREDLKDKISKLKADLEEARADEIEAAALVSLLEIELDDAEESLEAVEDEIAELEGERD